MKAILTKSQNNIVGDSKKGRVLWKLIDFPFYEEKTKGGHVLVGRKAYQEFGGSYFANRCLWILTRKNTFGWTECVHPPQWKYGYQINIIESLEALPEPIRAHTWVLGGQETIEACRPFLDEFYVINVHKDYEGDITFKQELMAEFTKEEEYHKGENYSIKKYGK